MASIEYNEDEGLFQDRFDQAQASDDESDDRTEELPPARQEELARCARAQHAFPTRVRATETKNKADEASDDDKTEELSEDRANRLARRNRVKNAVRATSVRHLTKTTSCADIQQHRHVKQQNNKHTQTDATTCNKTPTTSASPGARVLQREKSHKTFSEPGFGKRSMKVPNKTKNFKSEFSDDPPTPRAPEEEIKPMPCYLVQPVNHELVMRIGVDLQKISYTYFRPLGGHSGSPKLLKALKALALGFEIVAKGEPMRAEDTSVLSAHGLSNLFSTLIRIRDNNKNVCVSQNQHLSPALPLMRLSTNALKQACQGYGEGIHNLRKYLKKEFYSEGKLKDTMRVAVVHDQYVRVISGMMGSQAFKKLIRRFPGLREELYRRGTGWDPELYSKAKKNEPETRQKSPTVPTLKMAKLQSVQTQNDQELPPTVRLEKLHPTKKERLEKQKQASAVVEHEPDKSEASTVQGASAATGVSLELASVEEHTQHFTCQQGDVRHTQATTRASKVAELLGMLRVMQDEPSGSDAKQAKATDAREVKTPLIQAPQKADKSKPLTHVYYRVRKECWRIRGSIKEQVVDTSQAAEQLRDAKKSCKKKSKKSKPTPKPTPKP